MIVWGAHCVPLAGTARSSGLLARGRRTSALAKGGQKVNRSGATDASKTHDITGQKRIV
jgi:hypothetical protein